MNREQAGKPATPTQDTTAAKPTSKAASSVKTDWERIELDYRAGVKSLREIAEGSGVSHVAISKRARKQGWARQPKKAKVALALEGKAEKDRAGFVYVIYLEDSAGERFYKIGMSATFSVRYGAHQCASPFEMCVATAYFTGDMRAEERELHSLYSGQRVRGEWFRLTHDDLQQIAGRALLV